MSIKDVQRDIQKVVLKIQALQCKSDFHIREDVKVLLKQLRELKAEAECYKRAE